MDPSVISQCWFWVRKGMWHVNEPACTIYHPELPFRNYRRRAVTKPCSLGNWLFSSFVYLCVLAMACICAFSALTLLVGPQEGHPACKNRVVWYWRGYLSGARCMWPSSCHCHSLSLAPVKSRLVLPFWYRLTQVVLEKRPLNGCSCSSLHVYVIRSSWIWAYFHKGISLPQYSVLSFTRW